MTFLRLLSMEVAVESGSPRPTVYASLHRWESIHRLSLWVGCWLMACELVGGWSWCSRALNVTHCIATSSSWLRWLVATMEPSCAPDSSCPLIHRRARMRVESEANQSLEIVEKTLGKLEFKIWRRKSYQNSSVLSWFVMLWRFER